MADELHTQVPIVVVGQPPADGGLYMKRAPAQGEVRVPVINAGLNKGIIGWDAGSEPPKPVPELIARRQTALQ